MVVRFVTSIVTHLNVMSTNGQQQAKEATGRRVAEMISEGMTLGLGTGSTASCAICAIGERVRREGLHVRGVPTSFAAERLARESGIAICTLDEVDALDLAFDGADEVDPDYNLIKGRGAAHAREKVVAVQAARFVVLVDASKRVDVLGSRMPVPVEVIPMAVGPVRRALSSLGADVELRLAANKDGPVVTDQGMWLLDANFGPIDDPAALDHAINGIAGVVEHGIFVGMTTDLLVGVSADEVLHESVAL